MSSLPIVNKSYELYKQFTQINASLNKRWRFSLGMSIENSILELLEKIIMAKNAPKTMKVPYLMKASGNLEILIMKLRLLIELDLVNETRVFKLQAQSKEIGRMLGGWLKAQQNT